MTANSTAVAMRIQTPPKAGNRAVLSALKTAHAIARNLADQGCEIANVTINPVVCVRLAAPPPEGAVMPPHQELTRKESGRIRRLYRARLGDVGIEWGGHA